MKNERRRSKRKQKRKANKSKKIAYRQKQKRAFLEAQIELIMMASIAQTLVALLENPHGLNCSYISLPGHSEIELEYYLERLFPKILITYEYDL